MSRISNFECIDDISNEESFKEYMKDVYSQLECNMSKEEKKQIVERFLNAKTLKDVKTINESVKRELNAKRTSAPILERQFTAKQTLNETNIYDAKNNPSLDLMKRIDNLWK